jgi:hypothetical protein
VLIYGYSDVQTHQLLVEELEVVFVFNELVFPPIVEAALVVT